MHQHFLINLILLFAIKQSFLLYLIHIVYNVVTLLFNAVNELLVLGITTFPLNAITRKQMEDYSKLLTINKIPVYIPHTPTPVPDVQCFSFSFLQGI